MVVRFSLFISFLGMLVAFAMIVPRQHQIDSFAAGRTPALMGSHLVGMQEDGIKIPWLGWSLQAGDLRVPHFFGLHALQVLPLAGLILRRSQNPRLKAAAPMICSGYLCAFILLTMQALGGQPLYPLPPAFLKLALIMLVALVCSS